MLEGLGRRDAPSSQDGADSTRQRWETQRQHVQRREQQFDQAAQHEVKDPSVARGLTLEDGAELSEQGLQNVKTLIFGSLDVKAVGDALRKTDSWPSSR